MKKIENKPYRERELPTGQHSRSHAVKHQLHNSMDLPGKGRGKMKIKLLNTEHSIGSCNTEDVPVWVTKFGPAEYLAFFYFYQRDLIVLNEDHPKFKLYKTIVVEYEEFSSLSKKSRKLVRAGISRNISSTKASGLHQPYQAEFVPAHERG